VARRALVRTGLLCVCNHLFKTYITQSRRQEQLKPVHRARAFIVYGPVLFVTVFLHELGHCFATRQVSDPPSREGPPARSGTPCHHQTHWWPRSTVVSDAQVGGAVHGILLWPLGGLAFVGHAGSPARDLYVAVCGPLTHIPQACPPACGTVPARLRPAVCSACAPRHEVPSCMGDGR